MKTIVFVYGTLRRGFSNHARHLSHLKSLGQVTSAPLYEMIDLGAFPGILEGGTTPIVGELYAVDTRDLQRLDNLEGHPRFYERKPIKIPGMREAVEAYFLPRNRYRAQPRIESGDYARPEARRCLTCNTIFDKDQDHGAPCAG